MSPDLPAARSFMATHARLLDRRRLELLLDGGDATPVLGALEGYRNPVAVGGRAQVRASLVG